MHASAYRLNSHTSLHRKAGIYLSHAYHVHVSSNHSRVNYYPTSLCTMCWLLRTSVTMVCAVCS